MLEDGLGSLCVLESGEVGRGVDEKVEWGLVNSIT